MTCQHEIINLAGAGQSVTITIAIEGQHLLVEARSPSITFSAEILPAADTPLYDDLVFQRGDGKIIARPSGEARGPAMIVNPTYLDQFEILDTKPPAVSIVLNKPDMKLHTQVYRWTTFITFGNPVDVPLIVSGELFIFYCLRSPDTSVKKDFINICCATCFWHVGRFSILP